MLRWQQAEARVHAVDTVDSPEPDVPFRSLCGLTVTPVFEDFAAFDANWSATACASCAQLWATRRGTTPDDVIRHPERHR